MHKVIKEIKSSHLGYIQEKIEKLVEETLKNTPDKKRIYSDVDSGVFNGKEQLRVHVLTNDSNIWNKAIYELIEINEIAIKDRPVGYQQQHSTKFNKDKETRFYKIILSTEGYSLHYCFACLIKY